MRKQVKRKVYPKTSGIWLALRGAQFIPENELEYLKLIDISALAEFDNERGNKKHLQTLNNLVNLAGEFANFGIGPEVLPYVEKAQEGIGIAAIRWRDMGVMSLCKETRDAIREVIDYQDLQRRCVCRSKVYEIARSVDNKIQSNMDKCIDLT